GTLRPGQGRESPIRRRFVPASYRTHPYAVPPTTAERRSEGVDHPAWGLGGLSSLVIRMDGLPWTPEGGTMSNAVEPRTSPAATISHTDARDVADLLSSSRSVQTNRSYASALKTYTTWCQGRGYTAVPTSSEVVA